MFSLNKATQKKYDNYKEEQVIAAAEWWMNAIQHEIPRIKAIRKAYSEDNNSLAKQLSKNILTYGKKVIRSSDEFPDEKKKNSKQL